jgi:hypothetical protein
MTSDANSQNKANADQSTKQSVTPQTPDTKPHTPTLTLVTKSYKANPDQPQISRKQDQG